MKAQDLFDRSERRRRCGPQPAYCPHRPAPDLVSAHSRSVILGSPGCSQHAIAGVPVGLQRDVVEMPVRQPADAGHIVAEGKPVGRRARAAGRAARTMDGVSISTKRSLDCVARAEERRRWRQASQPTRASIALQLGAIVFPARLRNVGAEIAGPQLAQLLPVRVVGIAAHASAVQMRWQAALMAMSSRPVTAQRVRLYLRCFLTGTGSGRAFQAQAARCGVLASVRARRGRDKLHSMRSRQFAQRRRRCGSTRNRPTSASSVR